MTAIDRRTALAAIGVGAAGLALAPRMLRAAPAIYVSACTDGAGNYAAAAFDATGALRFATRLPDRGHDAVLRPGADELVVFARRPGTWAAVLGRDAGESRALIRSPEGRHFYGHGAYAPDGAILYATENLVATGDGLLGVYDARDGYRRIGEIPTRGIGPHDLAFLPGTDKLVIANGGIRTAPDTGREMLNPETIEPSLVLLRPATGELLWKTDLGPDRRMLSIRHLAVSRDGRIAFGCQSQGDPFDLPPLVGIASPGGDVRFVEQTEDQLAPLANYVGSVALDGTDSVLAATSPYGGTAGFWDLASGRWLGRRAMPDVCGVAPAGEQGAFVLTSGNSGVELSSAADAPLQPLGSGLAGWSWDNHLLRL